MRKSFKKSNQGLDNRFEVMLSGSMPIKKKELKENKEKNSRNSTMYYLGYVGELGFAISIPIVFLTLIGKYLDDVWNTYPKMTLSLLIVGCVISVINFIEVIKTILKRSKK
ncbi:MAG: hypothetical protein UU25_C0005G0022 [Microgenomates group bacterium GW2011_GWB1_40_9]|nr:MAG: hypothetical protein UU25_C0005G0022 [Microgenomates group bacterium GW2011_GWB1_40_9]